MSTKLHITMPIRSDATAQEEWKLVAAFLETFEPGSSRHALLHKPEGDRLDGKMAEYQHVRLGIRFRFERDDP